MITPLFTPLPDQSGRRCLKTPVRGSARAWLVAIMLPLSIVARPAGADPLPTPVGLVGHSLINHTIPQMMELIARDKGRPIDAFEQIINGSPLSHNWKNHRNAEVSEDGDYGDLHEALATRKPAFAHVILTERVAIAECIQWEDTLGYLIKWRNRALQYEPDAQVYFYSTWVGFKEGEYWTDIPDDATWRQRTLADGKLFEATAAQAGVDARSAKGKAIRLVPGHRAMVLLFDELHAGRLPWLGSNIRSVFTDGIHLNAVGHYYIACVMYAAIFNESPEGATGRLRGKYGDQLIDLNPAQARALQRLAWRAVSEPWTDRSDLTN